MEYTTNLKLSKFQSSDKPSFLDYNEDMKKIDEAVSKKGPKYNHNITMSYKSTDFGNSLIISFGSPTSSSMANYQTIVNHLYNHGFKSTNKLKSAGGIAYQQGPIQGVYSNGSNLVALVNKEVSPHGSYYVWKTFSSAEFEIINDVVDDEST